MCGSCFTKSFINKEKYITKPKLLVIGKVLRSEDLKPLTNNHIQSRSTARQRDEPRSPSNLYPVRCVFHNASRPENKNFRPALGGQSFLYSAGSPSWAGRFRGRGALALMHNR
jgi:hypothetical protein